MVLSVYMCFYVTDWTINHGDTVNTFSKFQLVQYMKINDMVQVELPTILMD